MEISDVKRINLSPGEVLVVWVPGGADRGAQRSLHRTLNRNLPDNLCLVVPEGVRLEAVSPKTFMSDSEQTGGTMLTGKEWKEGRCGQNHDVAA